VGVLLLRAHRVKEGRQIILSRWCPTTPKPR
jgi:hypothetical protein